MTTRLKNRVLLLALSTLAMTAASQAATVTRLVPAFAEKVPGVNGSVWQSELRFFNAGLIPSVVRIGRVLPQTGTLCLGFEPFTIQPGHSEQVRSIGCGSGAGALEIITDSTVQVTAVITNVGLEWQDPCCLVGFSTSVPVIPSEHAYRKVHTVPNMQIPAPVRDNVGRHNLILVNPGNLPITVTLRYSGKAGDDWSGAFLYRNITIEGNRYQQLNDVLPQYKTPVTNPILRTWITVEATSDSPFYILDSYVDNATNDATIIAPID